MVRRRNGVAPEPEVLLKWIRCEVPDQSRRAFSVAQEAWSALRGLPGFIAQVGGWCVADSSTACLLGAWRDRSSYDAFMRGAHDEIFDASGQRKMYRSGSVALVAELLPMPGDCASIGEAIGGASLLRVADCTVHPGRAESFIEAQRTVWQPGMAAAPGMLAGSFGCVEGADDRFLVATLWTDQAAHDGYARDMLPALRSKAAVDRDARDVRGTQARLEPAWRVA